MLTIKQITENTEAVIRGLEKKHFKNAKETIEQVIALNDKRRSTQNQLDKNLAEVNSLSRTIGQLMKEGKKEEAETARARVAELKEGNKELDATMTQAATDMQNALYTIPNIPYDSVPEGVGAEDNVVEKMGGMETELPKDALPHWELAKKYDLIDFNVPLSTFSWMKHANPDILKSCHRQWSTPLPVTAQDNFLTKKDKCTIAK